MSAQGSLEQKQWLDALAANFIRPPKEPIETVTDLFFWMHSEGAAYPDFADALNLRSELKMLGKDEITEDFFAKLVIQRIAALAE